MIMRSFIHSAIVALAVLAGTSAAMARPAHHYSLQDGATQFDRDHAFWDQQQRNGS
jgi:hypothetical protein